MTSAQASIVAIAEPPFDLTLFMLVGSLIVAGYLLRRRVLKRAVRHPETRRTTTPGTRILVSLGLMLISGILFVAPGSTSAGRTYYLMVIVPFFGIAAYLEVRQVRMRRVSANRDPMSIGRDDKAATAEDHGPGAAGSAPDE